MEKTGTFPGKIRDREIASTYVTTDSYEVTRHQRFIEEIKLYLRNQKTSIGRTKFSRVFLKQISNVIEKEDPLIVK